MKESEEPMHPTKEKIALLNDKARRGRLPGSTKMMLTRMVAALPEETLAHLRCAVASFDGFTEDEETERNLAQSKYQDAHGVRRSSATDNKTAADARAMEVRPVLRSVSATTQISTTAPTVPRTHALSE
jgi:hypothetical protein